MIVHSRARKLFDGRFRLIHFNQDGRWKILIRKYINAMLSTGKCIDSAAPCIICIFELSESCIHTAINAKTGEAARHKIVAAHQATFASPGG